VRFSLCATLVAGPLTLFVLAAPAAAQQPGGAAPGFPPPGTPGARPGPGAPGGAMLPQAAVAPQSAPAAAGGGTSVAVIDIASIFKNHVRFNAAMNDMKRDIEGFDATMQEEQKKIMKKAEALQTFNPTSPDFKKLDEEVAHLKSNFQIQLQAKKREFLEAEAKVYFNIYREVEEAVAVFAQRNGIRLVLRFTGDDMKAEDRNSVLQGVNKPVVYQYQLDITNLILEKVNAGATMPPGGFGSPGAAGPAGVPDRNAARPTGPTIPGQPVQPKTR
jgi:Skp family chaperone for outer membrane proteins